jgi:hypothetical protein
MQSCLLIYLSEEIKKNTDQAGQCGFSETIFRIGLTQRKQCIPWADCMVGGVTILFTGYWSPVCLLPSTLHMLRSYLVGLLDRI